MKAAALPGKRHLWIQTLVTSPRGVYVGGKKTLIKRCRTCFGIFSGNDPAGTFLFLVLWGRTHLFLMCYFHFLHVQHPCAVVGFFVNQLVLGSFFFFFFQEWVDDVLKMQTMLQPWRSVSRSLSASSSQRGIWHVGADAATHIRHDNNRCCNLHEGD